MVAVVRFREAVAPPFISLVRFVRKTLTVTQGDTRENATRNHSVVGIPVVQGIFLDSFFGKILLKSVLISDLTKKKKAFFLFLL